MATWLFAAVLLSAIQNDDASNSIPRQPDCSPISQSVRIPKATKIDQLTLVGSTELPIEVQDVIAESLKKRAYPDNKGGLEQLIAHLRDSWQEHGYFNVKVHLKETQELEDTPLKKTVAVTVQVDAGSQYRLGEIGFQHTTQFNDAELRFVFPLQQGDIFNTHNIQTGLEELREAYGAKGFINMSAIPSTTINENTAVASVTIDVDEGQQFRIGEINTLGIDPSLAQKLLHDAGLESGSIFDAVRLRQFFEKNKPVLPLNSSEVQNTRRHIDERRSQVDITMDFRGCIPR